MTANTGPAALPRHAARLFFRHHIENGVSVSLCLGAVALTAGATLGSEPAVFAATGAMCVSIVDQPGPLLRKLPMFLAALIGTTLVTMLAGLAGSTPPAMAAVVAVTGAGMALATAFGRPALTLGIAGVLALVLGMAIPSGSPATAMAHTALFFTGGALYGALAMLAAWGFDDRNRRMFLNEALLAFAAYLRARARLYDPALPAATALSWRYRGPWHADGAGAGCP